MNFSSRKHAGGCGQWLAGIALILLLGLSAPGSAAASDSTIAPAVAGLFVDEEKIVEGQVIDAEREANTVQLRLGHPPQSLTVSLIIGLLSNFPPDSEHYYLGKTVRVVGTIRSFRGAFEMVIHDPAHIELAGAPPAGAAASDTAASNAAVRDTVDSLKQRVHELEDQVRELHHPGGTAP